MKYPGTDLLERLLAEQSVASSGQKQARRSEHGGARAAAAADMLRLQRLFDEKYNASTPRELIRT